jgi:hypothetical protein
MRKFGRYIVAILFQFSFAALLLLITIRFQILNPDFLISSLRSAGAYEQSVTLFKEYLGNTVKEELKAAGLDELPIEQRQLLENEIMELTSAIEADEVQDLVETNIYRFYSYMNSEAGDIVLYFPIQTWGLPELITSQEPYSQLTENTTLDSVMGIESANDARTQLSQTKEYIKLVRSFWFIPLILSVLLLIFNYLLSTSPGKVKSSAWLLIVSGIYTLLMCGTAYVGSNEFVERMATYGEPILLMMGTIVPHLIISIIYLWMKIAFGMIVAGVAILIFELVRTKSNENKKKEMENPTPDSTTIVPNQTQQAVTTNSVNSPPTMQNPSVK